MNDNSTLGTVRDSLTAAKDTLSETHMNAPLDAIVQRGRATRRRHRLIGLTGTAAVAASAAVVVGLVGVPGSAPAHGAGTIRTATFTLVSDANGTDTLTIKPGVLTDAAALQNDLRQYGIPAIVTSGRFCSSDPAPAGFRQVVVGGLQIPQPPPLGTVHKPGVLSNITININPAAMPAGTELSFGIFQYNDSSAVPAGSPVEQDDAVLVNSSSYTCTSTRPEYLPSGSSLVIGHLVGATPPAPPK
jgi:hypothetical protein